MTLSWNEIKDRSVKFSKEWENTTNEEADAKPFLDAFFNVFGITRKKIGTFEHKVKKLSEADGYIDLLWKGTILVEMKSRGKNLDKAFKQAIDYTYGLKQSELPKYVLVCDFYYFRLYDTEEQTTQEFTLDKLVHHVQHFGYLLGYQKKIYKEQDPANIKAAEMMGKFHDRLEEIGYEDHPLEVYLVRILFCLFAEDTTIFNKQQFQDYIEQRTNIDGSDLASKLQELFQVLNTSRDKRFKNIDEQLNDFPYVNGQLFAEILPMASFDSKMRETLLECCYVDWSKISPAIFGSMFQSVMNPTERRSLGAHYTSESNILKLIKPLFLDELWTEFKSIRGYKNKLQVFHRKLSKLHFLDPACGCGNFLVITYRELRVLEFEVLKAMNQTGQGFLDVSQIMLIDVDQFHGIEYEEFPAQIAKVAMWLIDHQMNMQVSQAFGQYVVRLPLKKSANIFHSDALEADWQSVISKDRLNYVIGNPPFIGSKIMTQYQRDQIVKIFDGNKGTGVLDYVSGWYLKAAQYIQGTNIKVAFVSTNSIVQGEQIAILWKIMLEKFGIKINFAHRTFKWRNEAKGNAAVYCVIIGFANFDSQQKRLFAYDDIKGEAHEILAKNINPYLVDAKDILIEKRTNPICSVPKMSFGNMPLDGGNLLLSDEDKTNLIAVEPNAEKYILPLISAYEFLNGKTRWCLWLVDANPAELKQLPYVMKRIDAVKKFRLNSIAPSTKKFAQTPTLFRDTNRPTTYILIPSTSSENRNYIPFGLCGFNDIANNSCHTVPNGELFHFGVLTSKMHMTWVSYVCGRLESRYRYSKDIVYNNYPWPENPSQKHLKNIEAKAQAVLDERALFPNSSLADLYDPLTMPSALVKAHNELDKSVDAAYSKQKFDSDAKRMEFLFELYEQYTKNLFTKEKKTKKTKNVSL